MEDDFIQLLKKHAPVVGSAPSKLRWTLPTPLSIKIPDIESLFTEPEPVPVKTRKEIRTNEKKQTENLRKEIKDLKQSISEISLPKTVEILKENPVELSAVLEELSRLQEMVKRQGLYEYGSSLNVMSNGSPLGFTGALNFKSGFTTKLNAAGYIDVTGAAGGTTILTANGTVDGTNTAFTFVSLPSIIYVNGSGYRQGHGWSWNAGMLTATLDSPVGVNGDIYGVS